VVDPTEVEAWALQRLDSRTEWLNEHTEDPEVTIPGTPQVLHGDFTEKNLFFGVDRVTSVIDWGQPCIAPPAWEVVRAIDIVLAFDPARCRAFVEAYRTQRPMPRELLDAAFEAYTRIRAHDSWIFEAIYVEKNDRVRRFVRPGRFNPHISRWRRIRREIFD